MPIFAKNNGTPMEPAPEGLHQAVCCDVVDLGDVETKFGKKHMVRVVWQLEDASPTTGKRYLANRRYGLSLNEKASLRKDLEAWRGKKFTPQELDGFDLELLLGANAQIQITHRAGDDGRMWADVAAVVPAAKGAGKIAVKDYVRVVDRTEAGPAQQQEEEDVVPF
jgi:hypothetical protein